MTGTMKIRRYQFIKQGSSCLALIDTEKDITLCYWPKRQMWPVKAAQLLILDKMNK